MLFKFLSRIWRASVWEYGRIITDTPTMFGDRMDPNRVHRRHRFKHNVQFVLWRAGEQGHTEDYWHDMNEFWWEFFVKDEAVTLTNQEVSNGKAEKK